MELNFINEEPEHLTRSVLRACRQDIETEDLEESKRIEEEVEGVIEAAVLAINGTSRQCEALSLEDIAREVAKDNEVLELIEVIRLGVDTDRGLWSDVIEKYYREREHLSEKDGIVTYKNRVLIPSGLRGQVLETLHAAHQGCSSMNARVSQAVWWPKIGDSIEQIRASCQECTRIAPSQAALPPVPPPSPDFPMQQVCSDIAHFGGHS